jgi:hypothetical protein
MPPAEQGESAADRTFDAEKEVADTPRIGRCSLERSCHRLRTRRCEARRHEKRSFERPPLWRRPRAAIVSESEPWLSGVSGMSGGVRTCPRTYVRSVRGHMSECPKYVRGHMSGVSGVRRVRVSEVSEGVRGCPAICPYVRCEVSKPGIHL